MHNILGVVGIHDHCRITLQKMEDRKQWSYRCMQLKNKEGEQKESMLESTRGTCRPKNMALAWS